MCLIDVVLNEIWYFCLKGPKVLMEVSVVFDEMLWFWQRVRVGDVGI